MIKSMQNDKEVILIKNEAQVTAKKNICKTFNCCLRSAKSWAA